MDNIWTYIISTMIIAGVFILGRSTASPDVVTIYDQKEIDESTWVRRSTFEQRGRIIEKLHEDADSLKIILENRNSEILNLTQTNATLRLQRDSIITSTPIIIRELAEVPDTIKTYNQTYSDSLFTLRLNYGIRNGGVFAELGELQQLRPISFDIITDRRNDIIETFIYSSDFEELEFYTYYNINQPRLQWYHWAGIGFSTATLIYILL